MEFAAVTGDTVDSIRQYRTIVQDFLTVGTHSSVDAAIEIRQIRHPND
jgi:hypothetical protein